MPRKITRILLRLSGALFLCLVMLVLTLFFAIQSPRFQTWLGKKTGEYLSRELNSTIRVDKIRIKFFSEAELKNILVLDQRKDTLLHGDVSLLVKHFDLKNRRVTISDATLNGITAKVIRYNCEPDFNYQFLADYFGSADTSGPSRPWQVNLDHIILQKISFVYRDEKRAGVPPNTIDYDDLWLNNVNGSISDITRHGDTILAKITGLSATEKSGFMLNDFTAAAKVSEKEILCERLRISTPATLIKGTVHFRYDEWNDYNDFIDRVKISSFFEDSTSVSTSDIGYFAAEVQGLDKQVALRGRVNGFVSDLHLRDFNFAFGKNTQFLGDISINGLPDITSSYLHLDARKLTSSYTDIMSIPDYPFHEKEKLPVPPEVNRLGLISYSGKLDGFISDFTTYGTFRTSIGEVTSHLSLRTGPTPADITYKGRLNTRSFDAGKLLGASAIGLVDMDVHVEGRGADVRTLEAQLEGNVNRLAVNGYDYSNIKVNGTFSEKLFTGLVLSKDPNADFDFNGTVDFNKKMPELDFISTINYLNLYALNLGGRADSGVVSSQIFINIRGDNIDNLSGVINLDNTIYRTRSKTYELANFNILMEQQTAEKKLNLRSAYVNAVARGRFELSNLPGAFKNLLYHYYPTFFKKPAAKAAYEDELTFKMRVKNFNSIVEIFVPGLKVSAGSRAEADFDAANNKLNFQFSSPDIAYGNTQVSDLLVILNENGNTVLGEVSGKRVRFTDSLGFENFNFQVKSIDKDSEYNFEWDNLKRPSNKGLIAGRLTFGNSEMLVTNNRTSVTINDSTWTLSAPNTVLISRNGEIKMSAMELVNNRQRISAEGTLSFDPADSLVVSAANVDLVQFNPLLQIWKLTLGGQLNGHVALNRVNENIAFNGNLHFAEFSLNKNKLGALLVNARYNAGDKLIKMNGYTSLGLQDEQGNETKNITFDGTYHLDRREESLDFDVAARPANLKVLNPFLEDILTIKNAYVNGEAKIHGSPASVKIDGKFRLFNSEVTVDYTNVSYNITGDIEVMPDQIRFSDLLLREKGTRTAPQGTVNGNIFHRDFGDMRIDYDVTYRNMLVLNTTEKENSTYYGRIYGSGNMGIYGFVNDLHMEVTNTTTGNSSFVLPLDGPAEVGESDFIRFVKKDTVKTRKRETLTGFDLYMRLHATPATEARIILDNQHGDILTAHGEGDLTLRINTLGKFEMFGDYMLTSGNYHFTLENVISKKFEIEPGSSISWSGDPYNAEIDVTTTYRQRTSVAALLNDTTGHYKARVPVECKLLISGKLFTPQIKFAIDVPATDASAKARIASVLSDEAELNRQVFSFLLFRSFVTPLIFNPHGGGVTAGGAAASTGSEMLSNRVSEFLNTYVGNITGLGDLQLGLNYRPGNNNTTDAVDLALSKQFLNNKITVDGNFGVNNNQQMRNSGALIGDVNIDYKLSEDGRYRLKGFNRSNDVNQMTAVGGYYTQGIGFFYREEFETFDQLFDRYLKKIKKNRPMPQQ